LPGGRDRSRSSRERSSWVSFRKATRSICDGRPWSRRRCHNRSVFRHAKLAITESIYRSTIICQAPRAAAALSYNCMGDTRELAGRLNRRLGRAGPRPLEPPRERSPHQKEPGYLAGRSLWLQCLTHPADLLHCPPKPGLAGPRLAKHLLQRGQFTRSAPLGLTDQLADAGADSLLGSALFRPCNPRVSQVERTR
jgi:hypothetical protein